MNFISPDISPGTSLTLTLKLSFELIFVFHKKSQTPEDMFVRLGEYGFGKDGSTTSEDHEVEYFIIHSEYDQYTHENDISILKLKEEAQFTHFIR